MADGYGEVNLATIGRPLRRFAKLALTIDIPLVMPLFVALEKVHVRSALICSDISSRAIGRACEVDRRIRSWHWLRGLPPQGMQSVAARKPDPTARRLDIARGFHTSYL